MRQRALEILELPKILGRLAAYTSFSASQELALALVPSWDFEEISHLQRQTREARRLLELKPSLSIAAARDIRDIVHRAALGGILEPGELLEVQLTLACGRTVRSTLLRLDVQLPLMAAMAEPISVQEEIEREVARCITARGEVADNATPILRRLRAEIKITHQRLMEKLEQLATSSGLRHLIQDPIVTQRQGRYVIPIKADFKGQFKGIVHDQSSSGATVFIEPFETVNLNNHWRELQLEEQREVQRILRMLSAMVANEAENLKGSVEALADIDLALAKAKYAVALRATAPRLIRPSAVQYGPAEQENDSKSSSTANDDADVSSAERSTPILLDVANARHPLLGENVVPISIRLGQDFFVLVITGPNTGGKTVALKTVGLLVLMAQCGMQIPADEGSALRIFRQIFADIGDEQSIEQSLSTFSSHMKNVLEVLKEADRDTLVLLDELGAGTDPTEGSALARAILEYLVQRRVPTIATTHYSELKVYAHSTPGVENASVDFDPDTLAPTFRLSIGLPGRSNAIAIATRLGVPAEVIDAAVGLLDPMETQADKLLAQIQSERDRAEAERRAAERVKIEAEILKAKLEQRLNDIEKERQATLEEAWRQVEAEAVDVRARLVAALEAETQRAGREKLTVAIREIGEATKEADARIEKIVSRPIAPPVAPRGLRAGDYVLVKSLNQQGELIALLADRDEAEVQLGSFKVKVRARDVELSTRPRRSALYELQKTEIRLAEREMPPPQIEVRMWRVEQVLPVLDSYINEAYLAGMLEVRVIHGKGTGTLRRVVREQLTRNPLVRSFRTADLRDGGEGVTVVELAL